MPRSQPITVELEEERASLDQRLASGDHDPPSDVVRAGLRALDRERSTFDETIRKGVQEALHSGRHAAPLEEVMDRLRRRRMARGA
jgi:antitoxin ParD1/3/4